MIREAPTTSSSESNFADPPTPSDDVTDNINLTIKKLEQLSLVSHQQIARHEPVNFDGASSSEDDVEQMPIVKKSSEHVQLEHGNDKGIFSVSRVKKVELSEIPLATDICAACKQEEPVRSSHTREEVSHNSILLRDLPHDVPALTTL